MLGELWVGAADFVSSRSWHVRRNAYMRFAGEPTSVTGAPEQHEGATDPLTVLALGLGTDKAGSHHYTQHYHRHLEGLRDQEFALLEIGIGGYDDEGKGGASLRMWKHYFPRATIIGLDIEDKSFVEEERIAVYRGSQTDPDVLRRIHREHGPLKVIIDDGSHVPAHVRRTFGLMFPLLAADGIYAIEDTQTSYWPSWGGRVRRSSQVTSMALVKDLLDGLNHAEYARLNYSPSYTDLHVVGVHAYHNLVFIEKGDNSEPSNAGLLDR